MAGEIPTPKPPGTDWNKEVGGVSYGREKKRQDFWEARAKLKLGVEDLKEALYVDPKKYGLASGQEIAKFRRDLKPIKIPSREEDGSYKGPLLPDLLKEYFKQNMPGADAKTISKEVALTAHYINTFELEQKGGHSVNISLLIEGQTVEIKQGRLYIYRVAKGGRKIMRVDGAFLRPYASEKATTATVVEDPNDGKKKVKKIGPASDPLPPGGEGPVHRGTIKIEVPKK